MWGSTNRISLPVSEDPSFIAKKLFCCGPSPKSLDILPQELRDQIFDQIDTPSLLKLRLLNKAIGREAMQIKQYKFDTGQRSPEYRKSMHELVEKIKKAQQAMKIGEVIRKTVTIDCFTFLDGTILFDRTAGEYVLRTSRGSLVAVGPFSDRTAVEILPDHSMVGYNRPGLGVVARQNGESRLRDKLLCVGSSTIHGTQYIAAGFDRHRMNVWIRNTDNKVSKLKLKFVPPLSHDALHVPEQVEINVNSLCVIYRSVDRTKSYFWNIEQNLSPEIEPEFYDSLDIKHERNSVDGSVLTIDGAGLVLADPSTGLSTTYKSGRMRKLMPFSPCGTFVGAVPWEHNANENQFCVNLFKVKRLDKGRSCLEPLSSVSSSNYDKVSWMPSARHGWVLGLGGRRLPAIHETGAALNNKPNIKPHEIDASLIKERAKKFAISSKIFDEKNTAYQVFGDWKSNDSLRYRGLYYLMIHATVGSHVTTEIHEWIASYFNVFFNEVFSKKILWSKDRTACLCIDTHHRNGVVFELLQFKHREPQELWREKVARSLSGTVKKFRSEADSLYSVTDLLFPDEDTVQRSFAAGIMGAVLIFSQCSVFTALVLSTAFIVVVLSVSAFLHHFFNIYNFPRPWQGMETLPM